MNSLIVDTREKHSMEGPLMAYSGIVYEQITVGDYAIKINDRILACIERKSLADYGASIRDGRAANKLKMVDARERSEEQGQVLHVYYIIEGDLSPQPDTQYGGVKYSSIQSSIRHLMTEFGIMIIRTKNPYETARELYELYCSYQVRPPKTTATVTLTGKYELTDRDLLHKRTELTKQDKKIELLKSLPGVGKESAVKMSSLGIGKYIVNPDLAPNAKIRKSLVALAEQNWNQIQKQFIASVPGVGNKTAISAQIKYKFLGDMVCQLRAEDPDDLLVWQATLLDLLR